MLNALLSGVLTQLQHSWYLILPGFIILGIFVFLKSPTGKGMIGEMLINFTVNFKLDKNKYHLIRNVTFPTEEGTTQIDHIIVSEYGIFIIETKNMAGWIYGGEKQKTWTQKIYKHTAKFQNPLHQNYKHIKTLESALEIDIKKIFSVIVFAGNSTFKTEMPNNVIKSDKIIDYIKSKTEKIISSENVEKAINIIETGRLPRTLKTRRNHIDNVKSIIKQKAE